MWWAIGIIGYIILAALTYYVAARWLFDEEQAGQLLIMVLLWPALWAAIPLMLIVFSFIWVFSDSNGPQLANKLYRLVNGDNK